MKYCSRCLYPENHPLNLLFDDEGVCSGCRVHEEKDEIDWSHRFELLKQLVTPYQKRFSGKFDCIVPVSGGRDSFFILDLVKNKLGMNPLLVSYNRHHNTRVGIRNLAALRTYLDCDFYQFVLNPDLVKRINRETLHRMGSMYWHVLAGQTVFPVQVAVRLNIPLIIWGVHQGVDQVGMYSHLNSIEMSRHYRKEHDLMGVEAESLVGGVEGLKESELKPLFYPSDKELSSIGVRGIYLNNFVRWDSKAQHEEMMGKYNYETLTQQRTFDSYNDVECLHYNGVHDYIKYLKCGYGKVTDHATREIRLKRLSRDKAKELVKVYANVQPKDLNTFLSFNNLTENDFFNVVEKFRNPNVWRKNTSGDWEHVSPVWKEKNVECQNTGLEPSGDYQFILSPLKTDKDPYNEYTLLDRGWVDKYSRD